MPILLDTVNYIEKLANNQYEPTNATKALNHAKAVRNALPYGSSETLIHAALLHDGFNQGWFTHDNLRYQGYSEQIIDLIDAVSPPKHLLRGGSSQEYQEWINKMVEDNNPDVMVLKYADIHALLTPFALASLKPEAKAHRIERYTKPHETLLTALQEKHPDRAPSLPSRSIA